MAIEREINYKFSATENVTSVAGRVQKALKGARKSEGNEALEEIARLGRGAGALVVFELISKATEKAADAIKEFRESTEHSAVSWANYADAIFKSIPGFGSLYEAARKLRFELDGSAEEDRKREKQDAGQVEINGVAKGIFARGNLVGKEGIELKRAQARQELMDHLNEINAIDTRDLSDAQKARLKGLSATAKDQAKTESIKFERDYYVERTKIVEDGEAKIRELKSTNATLAERSAGHELAAQIIDLKSTRDKEVRAIKDEFDTALKDETDPRRRQELFRQRGERSAEAERHRRLSEAAAQEENRTRENEKRFNIADKGLGFLQKEAQLGKAGAAIEAGRLEIITEYAKKRQEISDLLAKENLNPSQRDALQLLGKSLSRQEKDALYKFGIATPRFSGGTAPTEENYFSTGVAAASRENDPANKLVEINKESRDLLKIMVDGILKIVRSPASFIAK